MAGCIYDRRHNVSETDRFRHRRRMKPYNRYTLWIRMAAQTWVYSAIVFGWLTPRCATIAHIMASYLTACLHPQYICYMHIWKHTLLAFGDIHYSILQKKIRTPYRPYGETWRAQPRFMYDANKARHDFEQSSAEIYILHLPTQHTYVWLCICNQPCCAHTLSKVKESKICAFC